MMIFPSSSSHLTTNDDDRLLLATDGVVNHDLIPVGTSRTPPLGWMTVLDDREIFPSHTSVHARSILRMAFITSLCGLILLFFLIKSWPNIRKPQWRCRTFAASKKRTKHRSAMHQGAKANAPRCVKRSTKVHIKRPPIEQRKASVGYFATPFSMVRMLWLSA